MMVKILPTTPRASIALMVKTAVDGPSEVWSVTTQEECL